MSDGVSVRLEEAEAAWRRAAGGGLESSVLQANLARVAMHTHRTDVALAGFREARAAGDRSANLVSLYDRFLARLGRHEEREAIYAELDEAKRDRSLVSTRRLALLLDTRRYDETLEELAKRNYLRGEREKTIRYQYLDALLARMARQLTGRA